MKFPLGLAGVVAVEECDFADNSVQGMSCECDVAVAAVAVAAIAALLLRARRVFVSGGSAVVVEVAALLQFRR